MALQADKIKLASGYKINRGFNIYTLIYQHSRIFSQYAKESADWTMNRKKLGFSLFPFNGHDVYDGKKVKDIPGNDFMLVSLSYLTGKDWRPYFDMFGLNYTSLASEQVDKNSTSGVIPIGMYVLEQDMPPSSLSKDLDFIPLDINDGTTLWKGKDSPTQCQIQ